MRSRRNRKPGLRGLRLALVFIASTIALAPVAASVGSTTGGAASAGSAAGQWTTYGGNFRRTAEQSLGPSLRPLQLLWRNEQVNGAVYGEPLIYAGRVFVGTESDVIYALDARNGRVVWSRRIGEPVSAGVLPCGDIYPTVGITSTMVIDPSSGVLYASGAVTLDGAVHHQLVALDLSTGRVVFSRDLDQPGWTASAQLQRAGLALDAGRVLVGFGGNDGDCSTYRGYLMAVPESGSGRTLVYGVPTAKGGAIWAPAGVSVEPSGEILAATGNGASTTTYDEGDSVLGFSPTLKLIDHFAPTTWQVDNETDLDLGSTAPVLLPAGRVLIIGKSGTAYLLDGSRLGGIGGEISSITVCNARGGNAVEGNEIFVACPDTAVTALVVRGDSLSVAWQAPAGFSGSPTVAGGYVWSVSGGALVGLNPQTGSRVVTVAALPTEHFAAPSAGEGLLVLGGVAGVEAFTGPDGYQP